MATLSNPQPVEDFEWDNPLQEEPSAPPKDAPDAVSPEPPASAAGPADKKERHPSLDLLLDIPLEITAELGRTRMIIHDLLQLGQGSVIELNKLAGEPLEILVNQKLVARGEVVVVNEKFGIRLTDIISPLDRIKQLG